jgi:hypothetical protein
VSLFNQGKPSRVISRGTVCRVRDEVKTLYVCPDNCRAEITMLYCVNVNGTASATVQWTRQSDSEVFSLIGGKNLGQGDFVLLTGATLVIEPGDVLTCVAKDRNNPEMNFMCTVIETFIPVG